MNPAARDEYLSTEVLTASPQKLQLMLIDAAIRAASQAQSLWTGERTEAVTRADLALPGAGCTTHRRAGAEPRVAASATSDRGL